MTRTGIKTAPGTGPELDVVQDPILGTDVPTVALRGFDEDGNPADLAALEDALKVADPDATAVLVDILAAVAAGSSISTIRRVAGATLSGHRLVVPDLDDSVIYADNDIADHADRPIWLTTGAVLEDESATLLSFGEFVEGSWTWTVGEPIFLGDDGQLTQTVPTAPGAAFLLQVALAISPTALFFNPKMPIALI